MTERIEHEPLLYDIVDIMTERIENEPLLSEVARDENVDSVNAYSRYTLRYFHKNNIMNRI